MLISMDVPQVTFLQGLWFLLIAVLWIGFFFLEGFDFGVAMLYQILSRKEPDERRVMVNSIGPTWDANEVWLLTAGGATFAAFPGWYSTLFSTLYLPLFLVLLGLIIRGVAFEYRALNPETAWKNTFDWASSIGSFIVALVFGVGFANFVIGIPVGDDMLFSGGFVSRFFGLFTPYALLGGVMLVAVCLAHGAQWLTIKTGGRVLVKAEAIAPKLAWAAAALVAAFVVWGTLAYATDNPFTGSWGQLARWVAGGLAVAAMAVGAVLTGKRPGIAFICTGVSILALFASIFVAIYGTLGFVGADGAAYGALNISTASSSSLTLTLMEVFAFIMVPIVLLYTVWAYTRFKARLSVSNLPKEHVAVAVA